MESELGGATGSHVFISYSHADRRWLDRLLRQLHPLVREGHIQVFADTGIRTGADWQNEIQAALDAASIAVLLISPDFLASDFIMDRELPGLLAGAASRGTTVMSSSWHRASSRRYRRYPAPSSHPPSRPLSAMRGPEWNKVLVGLAREIHRIVSRSV